MDRNDTCGTHVHVSNVGGYALPELRDIALSVLYFEPAFDALIPGSRREFQHMQSNWADIYRNSGRSRVNHKPRVQAATSVIDLIETINPNRDRLFAWNFVCLTKDSCHRNLVHKDNVRAKKSLCTIKFRQAPAIKSEEDMVLWIQLAYPFIIAVSVSEGLENLKKGLPCIGSLDEL